MNAHTGTLFIVGIHLGNQHDISMRAIDTLRSVSLIACEEKKEAERFLRLFDIHVPLIEINEHTEEENAAEVIKHVLNGQDAAVISDAGMPVFADPGTSLVRAALEAGIRVTTVPGPTSIMSALALSGFDMKRFLYYGFLSAKRDERIRELRSLKQYPYPIVFLDAPYRLLPVMEDVKKIFGDSRHACVACDLTMPTEDIRRGTMNEVLSYFTSHRRKCEYVIIVEGAHRPKK